MNDEFQEMIDHDEALKKLQEMNRQMGPQYFHRDGTPIISNDLMPDFMQWAMLFETDDRRVAQDTTLYGERLSTVFLGMDHSFMPHIPHQPILFETMLFAPESDELRKAKRERISKWANRWNDHELPTMEKFPEETYNEKHYPHDGLQLRYSTEQEAKDGHALIKLQCLIPPRWRRFVLYTIGEDELWSYPCHSQRHEPR